MTTAAIYCRVSSRRQEQEGFGLDYQERLCREYAARKGWQVVESFVFREAFTGTELDARPQLSKLRVAVPAQHFDIVLGYEIDRVQREDWYYGFLRDEWKPYGVRWVFVTEPDFDDDEMAETWRAFQGMFARMKRKDGLKKTRNGRIERGRQGYLLPGGYALSGYCHVDVTENGKTRKRAGYAIVPDEAEIVRAIFARINDGATARAIAVELNQRGVPTKRPRRRVNGVDVPCNWWPKTITDLVKNPAYKGAKLNFASDGNKTMTDVTPVVVSETLCPRIVDPDVWDAAQPKLKQNKCLNRGSTADPTQVWLKGFILCGHCGLKMQAHRDSTSGLYRYRCRGNDSGVRRCPGAQISARSLDRDVLRLIREFFDNPLWLDSQVAHLEATARKAADEITALDERLDALAKRKN